MCLKHINLHYSLFVTLLENVAVHNMCSSKNTFCSFQREIHSDYIKYLFRKRSLLSKVLCHESY